VSYHKALVRLCEIKQCLASLFVVNDRAYWHWQIDGLAVPSRSIASLAMSPALRFVFGVEAKMKQSVVVQARNQGDIATVAAIPAAWASTRNKFLAPKRKTPVPAVTGLHPDNHFVNKHGFSC
jgi:hypothetical protein